MMKINKIYLFVCVIFSILFLSAPLAKADSFKAPFVHGYVFGSDQNNITAIITWEAEKAEENGFRIEKQYLDEKETVAIYNPKMLGDDPGAGGIYADSAILLDKNYTYVINIFDRSGDEKELGRIELKIQAGLIKLSLLETENRKGSLALKWEAIENARYYQIYRDGKLLSETAKTDFRDKRTLDGMHQYEIKAFSEENNTAGLFKKAQAQGKEIASYNISLKTEKVSLTNNYLLYILVLSGAVLAVLSSFKLRKKR